MSNSHPQDAEQQDEMTDDSKARSGVNDYSEDFLEAVKNQYEKEFEAIKNIDGKANSMIATAGTVTGLLFGFGTFLITNIITNYQFISYAIGLLIIAIVSNVFAVFLCILSSRIRDYQFVAKHYPFFKRDGYSRAIRRAAQNYNEEYLRRLKDAPNLREILVKSYLSCNKLNHEINEIRARKVLWAQTIFLISLIIFPILVGFVLHAYVTGGITHEGGS